MAQAMVASTQLAHALRDGTFPDSNEILSSTLASDTIPELLDAISKTKQDLDNDLRSINQSLAGSVDEWIAQAKKVQQDIEQCKIDARKIVENHSSVQATQTEATEAQSKSELLRKEIDFTQNLRNSLHDIGTTNQHLRNIEQSISNDNASQAARDLSAVSPKIAATKAPRVRSILLAFHADLQQQTLQLLEAKLKTVVSSDRKENYACLEIIPSTDKPSSIADTIQGLNALSELQTAAKSITESIGIFAIEALESNSRRKLSSHSIGNNGFSVQYGDGNTSVSEITSFVQDFVDYLHSHLPQELMDPVTQVVVPKVVSVLITHWFNPAIPTKLSDLDDFDTLRAHATSLAQSIDSYGWQGAVQLAQWLEQAPRIWLTKRKAVTLDGVRRIFLLSKGNTHQVERVERQKASALDDHPPAKDDSDDWNTSWDDKKETSQDTAADGDVDDTSGWGFDEDEGGDGDDVAANAQIHREAATAGGNDDAEDAWGWGDDNEDGQPTKASTNKDTERTNDGNGIVEESQELTLTEQYTITDIPGHLVEVISRDIQDALSIQEHNHSSLNDIPAASGLLALPTLALAMFRATAPTLYTTTHNLSNMNLYNDTIYLADKLHSLPSPTTLHTLPTDSAAMLKFARSAYAREMDTQRTILNDLLDGAQGFSNCTQFPYSQEIANAITSTTDRLRTVHASWKTILSTSALLQSTGALLATVISKFITEVTELEDISEAQSHRLAEFTSQITSLQDLFVSSLPAPQGEADPIPLTAVYVSNWLKLQYLAQILESSLVDIEYLWKEGELALEFTAEEVVDLVKALFAESPRRKAALAAVRSARGRGGG